MKAISKVSVLLLLLVGASGLFAQEIQPIKSGGGAHPRLAKVRVVRRVIPHRHPWQRENFKVFNGPGVFLDDYHVLATGQDFSRAVSITVLVPGGREKVAATVLKRDDYLKLAILRLHRRPPEKGFPEKILPKKFKLPENPALTLGLKQIQCLSLAGFEPGARNIVQTVFLKGIRVYKSPTDPVSMPALLFSSWEPGIQSGDFLVVGNKLIGVVLSYDAKSRYGYAAPASYVETFLKSYRTPEPGQPKKLVYKRPPTWEPYVSSVVTHPGFEYISPTGSASRRYYNLSRGEDFVLVNRVFPYSGAFPTLRRGDIILEVNGEALGPGGTLSDSVYGVLPLKAALTIARGRLRSSGFRTVFRIIRNGVPRNVTIKQYAFSRENYQVAGSYKNSPYFIMNGFVFLELSRGYLNELEEPAFRLNYLARSSPFREYAQKERYVILDRILPIKSNQGYSYDRMLVLSAGGIAVRNLRHLFEITEAAVKQGIPLVLILEGNREVVLDTLQKVRSGDEVRTRHGIQYMENISNRQSQP